MAEYIERDIAAAFANNCGAVYVANRLSDSNAFPAADVAPVVHGRWLCGDYYDIGDVCSECDWDSQMTHPSYRYCPNCGARMDEVE